MVPESLGSRTDLDSLVLHVRIILAASAPAQKPRPAERIISQIHKRASVPLRMVGWSCLTDWAVSCLPVTWRCFVMAPFSSSVEPMEAAATAMPEEVPNPRLVIVTDGEVVVSCHIATHHVSQTVGAILDLVHRQWDEEDDRHLGSHPVAQTMSPFGNV